MSVGYNFYFDVRYDWGLLDVKSSNWLLRNKLIFPRWVRTAATSGVSGRTHSHPRWLTRVVTAVVLRGHRAQPVGSLLVGAHRLGVLLPHHQHDLFNHHRHGTAARVSISGPISCWLTGDFFVLRSSFFVLPSSSFFFIHYSFLDSWKSCEGDWATFSASKTSNCPTRKCAGRRATSR